MREDINIIKSIEGWTVAHKQLGVGLSLKSGIDRDTFMEILSYSRLGGDQWFMGGVIELMRISLRSENCVKKALKYLLDKNLIFKRERKEDKIKYTDYRTNFDELRARGFGEYIEKYCPDADKFSSQPTEQMSEPEFIPDEQEFVYDMNEMNFPEPELEPELFQPEPVFEPEPIQLYGEYQNVRLTDSEYNELNGQFGKVFTEITLKRFSEYVFTTNKYTTANFRSHFDVLKKWCGEDKVKAEKSAEKKHYQNLTKNLSESDTSNIYNKSIYKNSHNSLSQSALTEKNECSDKMKFNEVLKEMGSVFAYSDAKSENDFQNFDDTARQTEKCNIPFDFVGKPRAMKSALKFMFADSYNRTNGKYNVELEESVNGFIQSLAELASADYTIIRQQKVYGIDVVEKINLMFHENIQHSYVLLEDFMKFYAKRACTTTVHSAKAFMKAIWWEFLDNDVRTAHAFSELCYPAEKFNDDYSGFLNMI